MKQILAIAGSMVLALILMDTYQVVKAPSGLSVVKAGQALAADMGPPPPPGCRPDWQGQSAHRQRQRQRQRQGSDRATDCDQRLEVFPSLP